MGLQTPYPAVPDGLTAPIGGAGGVGGGGGMISDLYIF